MLLAVCCSGDCRRCCCAFAVVPPLLNMFFGKTRMRKCKAMIAGLFGMAFALGATPAPAEILTFRASLDGKWGAAPTGSVATGKARIEVDTTRQSVSVDMTVDGITRDALWDELVAAPIGPVHLHKYATATAGDSVLVVPLPYGPAYKVAKGGMRLTMKDYDYAAGAALLKSTLSFDEFVKALQDGLIVLNIHTDAFNPGEISGRIGGGDGPSEPGATHHH